MIFISKIKQILAEHKVFCLVSLLLPLYQWLVLNNGHFLKTNIITYSFYTVDYSMGFCSNFFIGSVYSRIVGIYTQKAVTVFVTVFYVLFILFLAYLVEQFVKAFPNSKKECVVLLMLFLTGPFTFGMLIKEFGMLDFFWVLFFLAALIMLRHKYARFFIPVLVLLMVLIHYGSTVCYVSALLLIMLFFCVLTNEKSEKRVYLILFAISLVAAAGLTLYFLLKGSTNINCSVEAFEKTVADRNGAGGYFSYLIFKRINPIFYDWYAQIMDPKDFESLREYISSANHEGFSLAKIIHEVKLQWMITIMPKVRQNLLYVNIIALPLRAFLVYVMGCYYKANRYKPKKSKRNKAIENVAQQSENTPQMVLTASQIKKKRFMRFLVILMVLLCLGIELIGIFFSQDGVRWLNHSMIIMFVFVFYILHYDFREGMDKISALFQKIGYWLLYLFLFFYANVVIDPYCFGVRGD